MAKRTPERVALAKRLRAEGRSWAEIAEMVSKGGRPVTEGAIRHWLRPPTDSAPPVALPDSRPATATQTRPDDSDGSVEVDIPPDELRAILAAEIRKHRTEAEAARVDGRPGDARQSSRLALAFTAQLQKVHSRSDEDVDTLRVKLADIEGARERAREKLRDLVSRLRGEATL